MPKRSDNSIIAVDRFIVATRDSGYKGTASAISELVDNAIQAKAQSVVIDIVASGDASFPLSINVLDDGTGMDRTTLREAMRFGGSSRFNDRGGLGRYGMGLPNASLSQARRLEVVSWVKAGAGLFTYLDVDEIAQGALSEVPAPVRRVPPREYREAIGSSGTLVRWCRCDRLDHKRAATIARRLVQTLGRVYRYFIWDGVCIQVNGEVVKAVDPLYLADDAVFSGAQQFQEPLVYEMKARPQSGARARTGKITVVFSELPVSDWHDLDNAEKRRRGISNGAGVSVVRGGREVDIGWFFTGSKRRENYDDWWRCEVRFDPVLDESFGITHTKQQVRPAEELLEVLQPDIESIAKALNGRVRHAHSRLKTSALSAEIEVKISKRLAKLEPITPPKRKRADAAAGCALIKRHQLPDNGLKSITCSVVEDNKLDEPSFFVPVFDKGNLVAAVNQRHRFYKNFYRNLNDDRPFSAKEVREIIQTMLLTAARAEAMAKSKAEQDTLIRFRHAWGEALAVALD